MLLNTGGHGFADVTDVDLEAARRVFDRRRELAQVVQQRGDVEVDVGVVRHDVGHVDRVAEAALRILQVDLIDQR